MSPTQTRSAFFGIFDSDGRPWARSSRGLANFQKGLESALKIAFLTQRQLIVPAGYLLDNPALQRIFSKYAGADEESRSFRMLCSEVIRVSLNESVHDGASTDIDWQATWDAWIRGTSSNRGQPVYLNCLSADAAEAVQAHADIGDFKRLMVAALLEQQGLDYGAYLKTLTQIRFSTIHQPPFEFDRLFRTRFLNRLESFHGFKERLFEKLLAAAEASASSGIRLSRSLLNNPTLALDIGVPEREILARTEYQRIAGTLAHYHHHAFAGALGLDAFTTYQIPTPAQRSARLLLDSFNAIAKPADQDADSGALVWPLRTVTFKDLCRVRLGAGQTRFHDSLNSIHDAPAAGDLGDYRRALHAHARMVAGIITLDFGAAPQERVAGDVAEATYAAALNPAAAATSARKVFPYFKDFALNLQKELQLRFFFRSISE